MSLLSALVAILTVPAFASDLFDGLPSNTQFYFKTPDFESSRGEVDTPASLTKLWTTHIGLKSSHLGAILQPEVSWQTTQNDKTVRALTIDAKGAPEFDPTRIVALLRQQKIKRILGEIIIIDRRRYAKPLDMSQVRDSGYCYNAKVNSINFHRNCVTIAINGQEARSLDPDMTAAIQTRVKMNSEYNGTRPHFRWLGQGQPPYEYVIDVWLKNELSQTSVDVLVPTTEHWMNNKITRLLKNADIHVVPDDPAFESLKTKTYALGDPKEFVDVMCKSLNESINIYADSVFLSTPAEVHEQAMAEFDFSVMDGSGLALANKMPGDEIFRFLQEINSSEEFAFYHRCLPAAGENGTLKDRLNHLRGRLIAKTATLKGMSHLAGYYKGDSKWRPFVFMLKNSQLKTSELRDLQDHILSEFLENR